MAEGQPGKLVFTATQEDIPATWANSTNISEILLELETRKKPDAGPYDEESRWIIRVAASTQYNDILSVETLSPSIIYSGGAISGHFNGGSLISIAYDSTFNARGWGLLYDGLIPTGEKIPAVNHQQQWTCAGDAYFAQTWNAVGVNTKLDLSATCYGENYIKALDCQLETRKDPDDSTKEQCRYIARCVLEYQGTDVTRVGEITNLPSGYDILNYKMPGSSTLLQLSLDNTFWGGTGKYDDETKNTTGYWTVIRHGIQAIGQQGGKAFSVETHLISPSLWFPAPWIE